MPNLDATIIDALRIAAKDLDFEFVSPFEIRLADDNLCRFIGLVVGFGSPKGTVVFALDDEVPNQLRQFGYFCSALSPSYGNYDRFYFMDTLDDWGYFGPIERRPLWYTGRVWT